MNIKKRLDSELYQMHANICKTFNAPIRLMIIEQLQNGKKKVSEMEQELGIRQATLSQHLSVLREKGIVISERQGQNIYYKISNKKILKACQLMKEVLLEQIERTSALIGKGEG